MIKYKEVIEINGQKMTKQYIASLNPEQREGLINSIFEYFRNLGWMLPELSVEELNKEYKKLVDYVPDINAMEAYNNVSLGNSLCQYFCRKSFYDVTDRTRGKLNPTMKENFLNDETLKKICRNRLGLEWYQDEPLSTFNITPKMVMYQGQRSMRLVPATTLFKAGIAKLIYLKYSSENDLVYDFSAGFGGRLLGAMSCNRRYLGVDPLTSQELNVMIDTLGFDKKRCKVVMGESEKFIEKENSIDFAFSSPPYFDQEYYSSDITQAYNKGEDYFYNVYWDKTLNNIKEMLKPSRIFALNIGINYEKMFTMAKDKFGEPIEIFRLRTIRSHLNKNGKDDATKYEPIYIFRLDGK
jgi:hypothetical protein